MSFTFSDFRVSASFEFLTAHLDVCPAVSSYSSNKSDDIQDVEEIYALATWSMRAWRIVLNLHKSDFWLWNIEVRRYLCLDVKLFRHVAAVAVEAGCNYLLFQWLHVYNIWYS